MILYLDRILDASKCLDDDECPSSDTSRYRFTCLVHMLNFIMADHCSDDEDEIPECGEHEEETWDTEPDNLDAEDQTESGELCVAFIF